MQNRTSPFYSSTKFISQWDAFEPRQEQHCCFGENTLCDLFGSPKVFGAASVWPSVSFSFNVCHKFSLGSALGRLFWKGSLSCVHIPFLLCVYSTMKTVSWFRAVACTARSLVPFQKDGVYFWPAEVKFRVLHKHVETRSAAVVLSAVGERNFYNVTETKNNYRHPSLGVSPLRFRSKQHKRNFMYLPKCSFIFLSPSIYIWFNLYHQPQN